MEINDLRREITDAQRLAERGQIILSLNEQLTAATKDNERLKAENEALKSSAFSEVSDDKPSASK